MNLAWIRPEQSRHLRQSHEDWIMMTYKDGEITIFIQWKLSNRGFTGSVRTGERK